MLARAAAKDSNLLMNIGPDGSGALPEEAVGVMSSVGLWMRKNGESIYGTSAGGVGLGKDVVSTRKDGVLYLHFLNPEVDKFAFGLNGRVSSVRCLEEKAEVTVERTSGGDAVVTVVRPSGYLQDLVVRIAAEQSDGMN